MGRNAQCSSPRQVVEMAKLSKKQLTFIHEYLTDMNGTQAAIRAGYSAKTAQEQASRLLSNAMVRDALDDAWKDKIRRADIAADDVLRLITRAAFADIRDFVTWDTESGRFTVRASDAIDGQLVSEVTEEVREFVSGRETTRKLKLINKEAMIKLLAQHYGIGETKVKLDVTESLADVLAKAWETPRDGDRAE